MVACVSIGQDAHRAVSGHAKSRLAKRHSRGTMPSVPLPSVRPEYVVEGLGNCPRR